MLILLQGWWLSNHFIHEYFLIPTTSLSLSLSILLAYHQVFTYNHSTLTLVKLHPLAHTMDIWLAPHIVRGHYSHTTSLLYLKVHAITIIVSEHVEKIASHTHPLHPRNKNVIIQESKYSIPPFYCLVGIGPSLTRSDSITELQSFPRNLFLSYVETMLDSTHENNMLLPWATSSSSTPPPNKKGEDYCRQ